MWKSLQIPLLPPLFILDIAVLRAHWAPAPPPALVEVGFVLGEKYVAMKSAERTGMR